MSSGGLSEIFITTREAPVTNHSNCQARRRPRFEMSRTGCGVSPSNAASNQSVMSALVALQTGDFCSSQHTGSCFKLDKLHVDAVRVVRPDARDDGVHDARSRRSGLTLEEQDLPSVRAAPSCESSFAGPFSLAGAVSCATPRGPCPLGTLAPRNEW